MHHPSSHPNLPTPCPLLPHLPCPQVDDLRGAVLAGSPDTRAGRIAFKVAYGLSEEQMRRWGLYVSKPLGPEESIGLFSEPALFLINPAGLVHVMVYSNASFARPDLKQIVQGAGGRAGGRGEGRGGQGRARGRSCAAFRRCTLRCRSRRAAPAPCCSRRAALLPPFPLLAAGVKMIQDRKLPIRGTYF